MCSGLTIIWMIWLRLRVRVLFVRVPKPVKMKNFRVLREAVPRWWNTMNLRAVPSRVAARIMVPVPVAMLVLAAATETIRAPAVVMVVPVAATEKIRVPAAVTVAPVAATEKIQVPAVVMVAPVAATEKIRAPAAVMVVLAVATEKIQAPVAATLVLAVATGATRVPAAVMVAETIPVPARLRGAEAEMTLRINLLRAVSPVPVTISPIAIVRLTSTMVVKTLTWKKKNSA